MQTRYENFIKISKAKLTKNKITYLILLSVFFLGLFLRVYRLDEQLGFYFDQGRDAQIVMQMIDQKKPVLIGPPIGVDGPFRGPFFYWILTPFYFFGNGNPVLPAVFLVLLNSLGIVFIFILGKRIFNKYVGLLAAIFYAISYGIISDSRWLANPNPAPVISLLIFLVLYDFLTGNTFRLPLVTFLISISLHFETAGALFLVPVTIILSIWRRKKVTIKSFLVSLTSFLIPLIPLLIFDLRHGFLISRSYWRYFLSDQSELAMSTIVKNHLISYVDTFKQFLFPNLIFNEILVLILFIVFIVILVRKNEFKTKFLLISIFVPILGFLFSKGNRGNLWGYYFLNYFPVLLIAISAIIFQNWRRLGGKLMSVLFMGLFVTSNLVPMAKSFSQNIDNPGEKIIVFKNQLKAIDWIYADSQGKDFNVDFYVPPVIPYSYNYLFDYYYRSRQLRRPVEKLNILLYTLVEPDPDNPLRIQKWSERQDGIGRIVYQRVFGNIMVQRRERLNYKNE